MKINNNAKKIALMTNHDDDIYCFRKELIESLLKEGHNVVISCPYGRKLELMPKNDDIKYVDIDIDRRGTNILSDLNLFFNYVKFMLMIKPDILLCYTIKPNIYASIAADIFGITHINNVTGLGSVLKKPSLMQNFIMLLLKTAFRKSKCIFFQNEENMLLAKSKNIISGEYKTIPGSGVDTERFPLHEYPTDEVIIFNYIGRVLSDKGVDDYIRAAQIIKLKYSNVEFNVIGFIEPSEGHYVKLLSELHNAGILCYRGSQDDVRPFIARSHATIHPSTYGEGISNVLLETAASGRPVITTNNTGCADVVEDGVTGYIYMGGDVNALVEKIELFLSLSNKQRMIMGTLGRKKVEQEFNRKTVINEYLHIINKN